jgi:hypothetical protein
MKLKKAKNPQKIKENRNEYQSSGVTRKNERESEPEVNENARQI